MRDVTEHLPEREFNVGTESPCAPRPFCLSWWGCDAGEFQESKRKLVHILREGCLKHLLFKCVPPISLTWLMMLSCVKVKSTILVKLTIWSS